jgi:prepilin-type N-terminal cleavage/methylation domain-containing protein
MRKKSNSGYSLVEVLIAVAITGVVLLTVVTLFYMGRRNVYSGKQMTYAVSVGTRVLEDLSTMTTDDLLTAFGIDDATAQQTVVLCDGKVLPLGTTTCGSLVTNATIINQTFADSTERDTASISTALDPGGFLASWNGLVGQSQLTNGKVSLVITPRNPAITTMPWTTARFTRVRVYVQWSESPTRTRVAFFDTTKVNRD